MSKLTDALSRVAAIAQEAISHLQVTEDHAAAVAELRASVSALALQMAEIEPQLASLRDRMTAAEARLDAGETPAEPEPEPEPEPTPEPEPEPFSLVLNSGTDDGEYAVGTTTTATTANAGVYGSLRYATSFGYDIPVPNGDYTVTVHLMEHWFGGAGARLFDVTVQDVLVADDLDIFQAAGGKNKPYDIVAPALVTDGVLRIRFSAIKDSALVNGVEIASGPPAAQPEPEPAPAPEPEPLPEPPPASVSSGLNVGVVFADGSTGEASFEAAEDWGDYTAPAPYGFVQHNRVAAIPAPDGQTLYVHFRPDADGSRQEVVFENGMLSATPAYIRPYRVAIRDGETVLADIDLAAEWAGKTQGNHNVTIKHWSYSRWRWQSAPRPVVRQPAELIAEGLLPPYDPAYISRTYGDGGVVSYDYPMDHAGITMHMGMTGERSDIGLVTEHQAEYIFKPDDPRTLGNVMAQAEGAASIPWHVRDPETHAFIDFYRPEHAGTNTHPNNPSHPGPNSPWGMDQSHQPALNYLPYLLTGDPYYLEGLQGQMNYNTMWTKFLRFRDGRMVINDSQVRGYAWAMRTLMQLARVTPDAVPSWLLPRAYYARYLADNMAWFSDTYSGPAATSPLKPFGAIGALQGVGGTHTSPWMQYMLAAVLGWGVLMGHENMREAHLYSLGYAIAMFNGESGWPKQMGGAYHQFFRRSGTETWAKDFAEAWAITQEMEDPKPGFDFSQDKPLFRDGGWYECYARGALGLGLALGVEEARGPWQYLHEQIQANLRGSGPIWKWAIGPATSGA